MPEGRTETTLETQVKRCIGDAYWIMLSPGPGNGRSAERLYENLKKLLSEVRRGD